MRKSQTPKKSVAQQKVWLTGTKKDPIPFTPAENKFIHLVLAGTSFDKAAEKAGIEVKGLRRGVMIDHILAQYGRLGVKWKALVEKGKKCLEYIIDDPEEKGATKVQAVKVVFWTLLQCGVQHLKEEEDLGSRDEAADKVLGPVEMPFEDVGKVQ